MASSFFVSSAAASTQIEASGNGNVIIANFNVPVDPGSSTFMSRVVCHCAKPKSSRHSYRDEYAWRNPQRYALDIYPPSRRRMNQAFQHTLLSCPTVLGASAGSYIAMATNRILMGPGSEIGPSTPIVVGGTALEQNHTEDAMIDIMQSLATSWGRNTTAAFNMVYADQAFSANRGSGIITLSTAQQTHYPTRLASGACLETLR